MGFFSRLFNWDDRQPTGIEPNQPPASDLGLDARNTAAVLAEIDVDSAIAAHESWKLRLTQYLNGQSQETFDPDVVCLDDRCDLGKWLHGPGRERLGQYPAFSVLVARHKYFHTQAAAVVEQTQSGQKALAERTLDSSFRHASNQVVLLLKELKRGLGR